MNSESEQRKEHESLVVETYLTFETDRATLTSIDTDSSLKSDVTCENADHLICEWLPQNPEEKTGNNCVNNSGGLGSLVIRATR